MSASSAADSPSATDCRARLLQAATEVFVAEGYRAGVDRIAAVAGVAKQTLYNHFPGKADLFAEVIRQATTDLLITLDDDGEALRQRLQRFGCVYRAKLLSPVGLGFYRTLIAETARFPDLAATFYRTGPAQTAARLRVVLEAAMQRGELRPVDPEFAVTTLLSMLVGAERSRYLFSGESVPEADPAIAGAIVDCFLRAFAPVPLASVAPISPIPPSTTATRRSAP